jgi:cell division protein FtsQ
MKLRRILHLSLSVLLLSGALALVGFARLERDGMRYRDLEIEVEEVDGMYLVDGESVRAAIAAHDSIRGTFYADVALSEVEAWVREALPAVREVEVYPGLDRTLHVRVTQRRPVARWHRGGSATDVYLDEAGETMPLSPVFTARVPLIHAETEAEVDLGFAFAERLVQSAKWRAFTDGIVVSGTTIELLPRLGGARIELGDLAHLNTNLVHLDAFYREQIARGNLNDYKKISLKYEGQIVAQRHY